MILSWVPLKWPFDTAVAGLKDHWLLTQALGSS
jgi:hypothetical protein